MFLQNISLWSPVHSVASHSRISLHLSVFLFASLFCNSSAGKVSRLFLWLSASSWAAPSVLLRLSKAGACPCRSGGTFPLQPPLAVSSSLFLQAFSYVPYHFSVFLCFCFLCVLIFLTPPPCFSAKLHFSAKTSATSKVVLQLILHPLVAALQFLLSGWWQAFWCEPSSHLSLRLYLFCQSQQCSLSPGDIA